MDTAATKCVGCGNCHVICTMGAISLDADGKSVVNQDECVECSTCYRVLRNEGYWAWFVRAVRKALSFFKLGVKGGPLPVFSDPSGSCPPYAPQAFATLPAIVMEFNYLLTVGVFRF